MLFLKLLMYYNSTFWKHKFLNEIFVSQSLILKNLSLLLVDGQTSSAAEVYAYLSPKVKQMGLAHDYEAAFNYLNTNRVDILLVDIVLHGELAGLKLIEKVREFDLHTPIIILSSNTQQEHLLTAINHGIDGFLTKPLNKKALTTSLNKVIERLKDRFSQITINDNVLYDFNQKKLQVDQELIKLGPKERTLLELLLVNKNKSVSKTQIRQHIWQQQQMTESALKSLFAELRKKLKYNVIINIPSIGWMIQTQQTVEQKPQETPSTIC